MTMKMTMMLAVALKNSGAEVGNTLPTEGEFVRCLDRGVAAAWRRCRPFFPNAVAAACVVVVSLSSLHDRCRWSCASKVVKRRR